MVHCGNATQAQEDEQKARLDQHMRREYRSLNRQYNKLEKADVCAKRGLASGHTLSGRMVRHLKDERRELMLLLHMINRSHEAKENYWNSSEAVDDMLRVYQDQVELVQACEDGLKDISQYVDHTIRMIHRSKIRLLAALGTTWAPDQQARRVEHLEKNLHHYMTLYNTRMTTCANTRIEITSLLKDRSFFFRQYLRFKRRISWLKHNMNNVVEKANKCYDRYDDAKFQLRMISRRNLHECLSFVTDMKESVRFLRNDRYNRIFVEIKERVREMYQAQQDKFQKARRVQLETWEKTLPRYRHIFKLVTALAGSHDVDRIRQLYIDTDHKNMDTFLTLCFLSNCIQGLENEIDQIRITINNVQESVEGTRRRFAEKIKQYSAKEIELMRSTEEWNHKWEDSQHFMHNLVTEFEAIFNLAGAQETGVFQLLLESEKSCTPHTIRLFCAILEHRVTFCLYKKNQLSKLASAAQGTKDLSAIARLFKTGQQEKPLGMGGPYKANIIIPPALDKSDADEDERTMSKHPLKYAELKEICREMAENNTALIKVLAQAGRLIGSVNNGDDLPLR